MAATFVVFVDDQASNDILVTYTSRLKECHTKSGNTCDVRMFVMTGENPVS